MWIIGLLAFDACCVSSLLFPLVPSLEFSQCRKVLLTVKYQTSLGIILSNLLHRKEGLVYIWRNFHGQSLSIATTNQIVECFIFCIGDIRNTFSNKNESRCDTSCLSQLPFNGTDNTQSFHRCRSMVCGSVMVIASWHCSGAHWSSRLTGSCIAMTSCSMPQKHDVYPPSPPTSVSLMTLYRSHITTVLA